MMRFLLLAILATLVAIQDSQRRLPDALEAKDCSPSRSKDELPNDRFTRKGGRETKASVRYDKNLLTVDGIEQGRDPGRVFANA